MTEPGKEPGVPPDDRELEEFLAGRSPLSRAWREGEPPETPPELDAKVLDLARAGLRRRPRRLLRWDGPLALVASTFVVLGLAWLTQSRLQPPSGEAREPVSTAVVSTSAPATAADEARRQDEPQKPLAPPASPMPQPAPRPAPPAKVAPPRVSAAADAAPLVSEMRSADAPAAAPPVQAEAPAPAPAPARDRAAQAVPSPPPPAPMAFPGSAARQAGAAPAPLQTLNQQREAYGRLEAAQAKAEDDPCAAGLASLAAEARSDPGVWLERIRALRDAGTADTAKAELACFAARHPQAEIPDDLKPLRP
jgi:outer membrane biosynthesis protein TonB